MTLKLSRRSEKNFWLVSNTLFIDLCATNINLFSLHLGILCIVFFLLSFPFVLGNGLYLFQLFDQFAGTVPLLLIGLFEFIAVGWVCGVKRYVT